MNNNNEGKEPGKNNKGNNNQLFSFLILMLVLMILMSLVNGALKTKMTSDEEKIKYSDFIQLVTDDKVSQVEFDDGKITIVPKKQNNALVRKVYVTASLNNPDLIKLLEDHHVAFTGKLRDPMGDILLKIITFLVPLVLFYGIFALLIRKMGAGSGLLGIGKSQAKAYIQKDTGICFHDVAGEDEAKESLQEVVDFLHNPTKYTAIGAKLPKGVLLVGPPGTGKTLLAKAVAGEANVPFFSLSGSAFVEMFVGVGASRVRDLFEEAKKNAPCIIFIDEIDAIGKSRDSRFSGGNDEREQTLNQLLAEMDGFDTSKGLLILAATNRPEVLDQALLRPGRFDRRVIVDKPDLKGRTAILKVHAKNVLLDETVNFEDIALATSGAVGSDLANMVNEAAILAVKDRREAVSQKDLFGALELVLVGKEKKDRILSPRERRIVSYHEVGHALVNALTKDAEPVKKITIVPRTMGALGYVIQVPEEEKYLNTKAELYALIVGYLGGRAAEDIVFNTVTTGAQNDIEKATHIARSMVTLYGMSERFGVMGLAKIEDQYLSGRSVLECSDKTEAEVDKEVHRILEECYNKAKQMLSENRKALDNIAEFLIARETITGKEFMDLLHRTQNGEDIEIPTSIREEEQEIEERIEVIDEELADAEENMSSVDNSDEDYIQESEGIEYKEVSESEEELVEEQYEANLQEDVVAEDNEAEQVEISEVISEEAEAPKKRRGRPKKGEAVDSVEEKPKKSTRTSKKAVKKEEKADNTKEEAEAPKKRRGRPKKSEATEEVTETPKKRRGRPKKTEDTEQMSFVEDGE